MAFDENARIAALQSAVDVNAGDGGTRGAVDAELVLFIFVVLRAARQRILDLEARVSALENA